MSDIKGYTELTDFRYERKYVSEFRDSFQVEQSIKMHPAGFSEIFNERYINNVYFDTARLDFFYDNSVGRFDRVKYRIRWYGDLFGEINNPILELKIKQGPVGIKRSFKLKPFIFDKSFNLKSFNNILANSDLPDEVLLLMKNLEPSLINRYSRKYYKDFSRNYRITIDKNINYMPAFKQNFVNNAVIKEDNVVVELKYEEKLNNEASNIANNLPFRLFKNSKYVNGIQLYYDVVD